MTTLKLDAAIAKIMIWNLRSLGKYESEPIDPCFGICHVLEDIRAYTYTPRVPIPCHLPRLWVVAKTWRNYSGSEKYPLLGGRYAYTITLDKWAKDSKYGRDRREFCLYLADMWEGVL